MPFEPSLRAAILLCAAGIGLACLPQSVTEPIRTGVRDLACPGQMAAQSVALWCHEARQGYGQSRRLAAQVAVLNAQLADWQLRCRRLQLEKTRFQDELIQTRGRGFPLPSTGEPLAVPELLEAAVVGEETINRWSAGKLLDCGRIDGISGTELVLEKPGLLIDQGRDSGVELEQPAYVGGCVVGRVVSVGRWTSTVQMVTDPAYSGLIQLARQTPRGLVFGAEGILDGQGDGLCRIKLISSTEPVSVGDLIFTGGRDGVVPWPMYYGEVVAADLKPGAPHWDIQMKPALSDGEFQTVHVLRQVMNPERLAQK